MCAADCHIQYTTWAADGQGVDRHLFGLKKMLKQGKPLPEIYTDPAFGKSNHWELSTSQLSSRYLDAWGYGESGFLFFFSSTYLAALS
jgi:carnitine O-acetyltransferase